MDKQKQDNQVEPIYNSSVPIQDVALKTYRERWTMVTGEGQGDLCWRCGMMMMTVANFQKNGKIGISCVDKTLLSDGKNIVQTNQW